MAVLAGTFAFTSCSKDDDAAGDKSACQTCSMSLMGQEISSKYCDNGDGTYTQTTDGQEATGELPEGMSFNEFIKTMEKSGMSCK